MRLPVFILLCFICLPSSKAQPNTTWLLDIRGAIGVATMEYVVSGLDAAQAAEAHLIILRMDTPGGLDNAMRAIIQRILASPIPIVAFVAPQGARAASAGTYILYAAHLAAMSPATTLGAATPVQLGAPASADPKSEERPTRATTSMERKVINDAIAYIEGLADLRGRNRDWAVQAVGEAASLSAQDALALRVINLVAQDIDHLLRQLQGKVVSIYDKDITLATADTEVITYAATWRHELLSILTNPNVAYMLLLAGAYGLFFELTNPGLGGPGILGALCIFLAMYAFQLLPINYAGAAFILLGLALLVAEAMVPSFGILGLGGIGAFVIGSIILMDTVEPAFQIATPLIVACAFSSSLFTFLTLSMLVKSRKQKLVSGAETMLGETALITAMHGQHPMVSLQGELWRVEGEKGLKIGDEVKVSGLKGLTLMVTKQTEGCEDG